MSVLPESPVRVKVGKAIALECVSAGEPRSSARWTRIGAPTNLEQRAPGLVDSHTVLQVMSGGVSPLDLRPSQGPFLSSCLEERVVDGLMGDELVEKGRDGIGG